MALQAETTTESVVEDTTAMESDEPMEDTAAAASSGDEANDTEKMDDSEGGADAAATEGGGGKKPYNRQAGRGMRRHTPYGRSNHKAVFHQSDDSSDPSCRVYVGNLSWDVTWRELKDHMKTTGCEVTRADILATPDGRSKGCGIVEFATSEGAQRAVVTLNDSTLMGRQIFVREDREDGSGGGYYTQQPSTGGHGGGGGGGNFASGGDAQSRRVYVGNLSWNVAWQDLKDHMRQAGEVSYSEVMKEADGRSKGCGIVEFATPEEAQEAISTLTDTELKGRMIFVREDRETTSGGGGGGGGGFQGGGRHGGSTSVYVGNLAYETSWQDLKDHMRQAGNVDNANILTSADDGRSKGCGIVQFQRPQDAIRAIRELHNSVLNGRPIFVREDREQGGGNRGGGGYGNRGGHSGRGGGGGGGSGGGSGCQLFVGNLSFDTNWRDLKDHFRQCGDVERAEVMENSEGKKKGFGTVRFFKEKDAQNAIRKLNGVELQGRPLEVRIDQKAN